MAETEFRTKISHADSGSNTEGSKGRDDAIIWANTTSIQQIGISIAIDTRTLSKKTMFF